MTTRLLVPLDGSTLAEAAVPWAAYLAQTRGYTPVLAQIIPWPTMVSDGLLVGYTPPEVYDEIMDAEREGASEYLEKVAATFDAQGIKTETVIRQGPARSALHDLVDDLGIDAIVMATHGRSGWRRTVLGSVANSVVQSATVPVFLVHAGAGMTEHAPAFTRVLVPLDGSELAERALDAALAWGHADTTLVVARVVEPLLVTVTHEEPPVLAQPVREMLDRLMEQPEPDEDADIEPEALAHPARDLRDEAGTYLKSVSSRLVKQGAHVETDLLLGAPAEQILTAARAHNADVIVMGTHGRSGPARWFLGSVADDVVRHTDRPVLLVSMRTRDMQPPSAEHTAARGITIT